MQTNKKKATPKKTKANNKPGIIIQKLLQIKKEKSAHWLLKSEPDAYSIDDLKKDKKTPWDGIRDYHNL